MNKQAINRVLGVMSCLIIIGFIYCAYSNSQSKEAVRNEKVNWEKIKKAYDGFLECPSSENATAFRESLPLTRNVEVIPETSEILRYIFEFESFALLKHEIWAGNRPAVGAAFRLCNITDAGYSETLWSVLGDLVRINPLLFLEALDAPESFLIFDSGRYPVTARGVGYDERKSAAIYEMRMRVKALEGVKEAKHERTKAACIRQLKKEIETLSQVGV